jgi:hypothetical protein
VRRPFVLLTLTALLSQSAAAADLHCTDADKATWLPPAQIKQMLQQHGFTSVGQVAADEGNCYVVQATDQTGAQKTLYLDPTDGALMGMK